MHPFIKLLNMKQSKHEKPHIFNVNGRWYRVDVPTDVYIKWRHTETGQWLNKLNGDGMATRCKLGGGGDEILREAIARRVRRTRARKLRTLYPHWKHLEVIPYETP